ncbi:tit1 [Candida pseudojiufengensis]|uniref:tit1 n=1 Tax=Candida pseudojiufengensis TaxID=497109 RepID=UPI0022255734|nr:tit1 [Candida pseudojiufengensis]KAI5960567.1 tit1 [Candida pseudojiufengensis]
MSTNSLSSTKKPIISIVGTTGVGKSQFSIELAKHINGEIINADSMQVYKKMDLITNKHPIEERENIPHHVIDYIDWNEEYHIHKFTKDANLAIENIHQRGKIPIVVGGTHYYLQSLLFNNKTMDKSKEITNVELTTDQLNILDGPTDELFIELKKIDPIIAEKFHPKDHRKLRRALEIWYTTSIKPSEIYHEQKIDELEESSLKYNTIVFWLYSDPITLNDRLDSRVDKMFENGAFNEIDELYKSYVENNADCTMGIYQVIGFKEFLPWLKDLKQDSKLLEEGIERMKIRTRQYAKYQIKWIQKTLHLELEKESKFDFKNGGKLFVLNATDLDDWDANVKERGLKIIDEFLSKNNSDISINQLPPGLESLFTKSKHSKSNKNLNSELQWKHFECDICKDSNNSNFIAIGELAWKSHLNGKRHKKNQNSDAKRKHVEEMIKKYKKGE